MHQFLQDQAGKERQVAQHRELAAALSDIATAATDTPTRRYFYFYLPYHLAAAQERARLDALLLDPGWVKAKLEATANPQALVADYQRYGADEAERLIGGTLRLMGPRSAYQLMCWARIRNS